ncbi:aldo/keto reductase [Actinocatenispora rupis]|uniref:Oxidoreductase n=1 Tax=Actinocatenispora rupis TaxID=519421 RepID=A0A8J3J020_9ACTN|nr:aldo/keto reductase [Actinocatenispora rupis]GID09467.1 oxidoreductase [Actinocatenispora rupis]
MGTQANGWTVTLPGGVEMPLLGFGTWQARGDEAYRAVATALDAGYRHVDTATAYGNEKDVGRAVTDSGLDRGEVFVTTKLPPDHADQARDTLRRSLDALDTGYVDLWLIHWPPGGSARPDVWRELIAARDEGLARAVGVSNYATTQLDELIGATGVAPAVNQIKWAPALYDAARLAECRDRGVVLEGYSPFRATNLTADPLVDAAEAHGVTPARVVLRWHLQHGVVVIPKSVTPERIAANVDVFGFTLTDDEMAAIDGMATA